MCFLEGCIAFLLEVLEVRVGLEVPLMFPLRAQPLEFERTFVADGFKNGDIADLEGRGVLVNIDRLLLEIPSHQTRIGAEREHVLEGRDCSRLLFD